MLGGLQSRYRSSSHSGLREPKNRQNGTIHSQFPAKPKEHGQQKLGLVTRSNYRRDQVLFRLRCA